MNDMARHFGTVAQVIAVHLGIDGGGPDGGVEGLDMQPHEIELAFRPGDLGIVHLALGLGEIQHRGGVGLKFLGTGEAQLRLGLLNFEL